jgi:hypothetical protein
MLLPNISAMYRWLNNFMPGTKSTSQDFLQLVRASDGTILGWIDENGKLQGSLALSVPEEDADPSSIWLEDDFVTSSGIAGVSVSGVLLPQFVGQLNWLANTGNASTTTGFVNLASSAPPYMGSAIINIAGNNNPGQGVTLCPSDVNDTGGSGGPLGFPLTLNTGWEANFVFKFPFSAAANNGNTTPFAQKRLYLGFAFAGNRTNEAINPYFNYGRPSKFIGLRYDTDPGNSQFAVTGVENASFGSTTYTGYSGDSSTVAGATFTVAGYSNPDNNGTFVASGSAGGTLVLNNPNGVAVSAAGTATLITPSISDTTYHFECVQNPRQNSNAQGTSGGVFNTGIAPDNNWHRFRMRSIVQGEILFSIDGGTETMISMGMDSVQGTALVIETSAPPALTPGYTLFGGLFGSGAGVSGALLGGTNVVVSGSNYPTNNGSWPLLEFGSSGAVGSGSGSSWTAYSASLLTGSSSGHPSGVTEETGNANLKFSWYNTFSPAIIFGNDTQATPPGGAFAVDYFGFTYSPRLALDFNGTANPTLPRYFPGQV